MQDTSQIIHACWHYIKKGEEHSDVQEHVGISAMRPACYPFLEEIAILRGNMWKFIVERLQSFKKRRGTF